jgi:DNA polymerase III epsilon subunit family exonuclease
MSHNQGGPLRVLDELYQTLLNGQGFITIEEFNKNVLHADAQKDNSIDLVASIVAMDGRFIFSGDKIVLKPQPGSDIHIREKQSAAKTLNRIIEPEPANILVDSHLSLHVMDAPYVVFDLETTGISSHIHKVIEIGAVKLQGTRIVSEFKTFVDPKQYIPRFITELTGITGEMLRGAPEASEAFWNFYEFLSSFIIVAHNISFDRKFLKKNLEMLNLPMPPLGFCTMKLARRFLIDSPPVNFKLPTLKQHFGIEVDHAHRALDDARATAEIFRTFLETAEKRGIDTVKKLYEFENLPLASV